jgi:hypothetical protein
MDDYSFAMQQRTFDVHGYALNPSTASGGDRPLIGSLNSAHQNGYASIDHMRVSRATKRETKRKRGGKGDAGVVDGEGAYMGPWAEWAGDKDVDPVVEEEAEEWREEKKRREEAKEQAQEKMRVAREEKSIFHGECLPAEYACVWLRTSQGRSCSIMPVAHTCTFRQTPTSSSTHQKAPRLQTRICRRSAFTPGRDTTRPCPRSGYSPAAAISCCRRAWTPKSR